MTLRTLSAALAAAAVAVACFGTSEVTEAGKALPQVEVEFPEEARPGSVQDAVLTVTNPGPGDMQGVTIAFARVGNDYPIVDVSRPDAVVSVSPEPKTVDDNGTLYQFVSAPEAPEAPPLVPEGESITVTFRLRVPERRGVAANSVTVSASEDVERIRGLRLETDVL